jgi:hypothetical protein
MTFHWGWLLASLLLGLAMGWIAVVHRGQGVSKRISWWLAGLVAALVAVALARLIPRPSRLLARSWSADVCIVSVRLHGGIVAARLGAFAQRAGVRNRTVAGKSIPDEPLPAKRRNSICSFPAAVGMGGRRISRKLHFLVRRVAVGEFALPGRMQQNCTGIVNSS